MTDFLQIKSVFGIGSKVLETSERLVQVFKFFQTYPTTETRNLNYLITTSYLFQLEDVSCSPKQIVSKLICMWNPNS